MKIKNDFVTNSSSVSFIIAAKGKMLKKDLPFSFNNYEHFRSFDNIESLISYVQDRKCDWIDKVRGSPDKFIQFDKDDFYEMKRIISDGMWSYRAIINNDWDRIETFHKVISSLPFEATITKTESH